MRILKFLELDLGRKHFLAISKDEGKDIEGKCT